MSWAEAAAAAQAPVFPIRIDWDASKGKWTKRPLTAHGHKDASHDVSRFNWAGANGYGIRMGDGWYALDLDDYKPESMAQHWLTQWNVPTQTRTHQTVSGGRHLIFRTLGDWRGLPSRQAVVPGLDTRGDGGWIAYGKGYGLLVNAHPAVLPHLTCFELSKVHGGRDVTLMPVAAVDTANVWRRLNLALTFSVYSLLPHRWAGGTVRLHDTSASGFDMSMAKLLALKGFAYSEIHYLLSAYFVHGVVARDGFTRTTDRAVKRAAARATQGHGITSKRMLEMFHGR